MNQPHIIDITHDQFDTPPTSAVETAIERLLAAVTISGHPDDRE